MPILMLEAQCKASGATLKYIENAGMVISSGASYDCYSLCVKNDTGEQIKIINYNCPNSVQYTQVDYLPPSYDGGNINAPADTKLNTTPDNNAPYTKPDNANTSPDTSSTKPPANWDLTGGSSGSSGTGQPDQSTNQIVCFDGGTNCFEFDNVANISKNENGEFCIGTHCTFSMRM